METENLENILTQIAENKLTEEDQEQIKKILGKYVVDKNATTEEPIFEEGFELPDNDWQEPEAFELDQVKPENITQKVEVKVEKIIPEIDSEGQYQLPLESSAQLELDLTTESPKAPIELNQEPIIETQVENEIPVIELNLDGRKEPILTFEGLPNAEENAIPFDALDNQVKNKKETKFGKFENMAQNALGKMHNLLNFKDSNGKIDWYGKAFKTAIVLKGVKNVALNNKVMNQVKSYIGKKYNNSKFGIKATQISDTIVVNLMSREERYNKDFKGTMTLLGYNVTELIKPNSTPMLTLQDVSDNVNKVLKEKLNLSLVNGGYASSFISSLNEESKVEMIKTVVWPQLTQMIAESLKLFEALKEVKSKNPLFKEIAQMAKKNNMQEDLFVTMLLKTPDLLKEKGVMGLDKLLNKKTEIEEVYFKNEELSGKNFIVIQNLVKASSSIQKLVASANINQEQKQNILEQMQNTVVKSDKNKKVLFKTVQDSVSSSLQDTDFVKSLRDVNESILKIRKNQSNQTETTKPRM